MTIEQMAIIVSNLGYGYGDIASIVIINDLDSINAGIKFVYDKHVAHLSMLLTDK